MRYSDEPVSHKETGYQILKDEPHRNYKALQKRDQPSKSNLIAIQRMADLLDGSYHNRILSWKALAAKAGLYNVCGATVKKYMNSEGFYKQIACHKQ
jgi:hypothetical protein